MALFGKKPTTTPAASAEPAVSREVLIEEKRYRAGTISILDLIAPAALDVQRTYLRLGQTYVRTIFVITYPRYITMAGLCRS